MSNFHNVSGKGINLDFERSIHGELMTRVIDGGGTTNRKKIEVDLSEIRKKESG